MASNCVVVETAWDDDVEVAGCSGNPETATGGTEVLTKPSLEVLFWGAGMGYGGKSVGIWVGVEKGVNVEVAVLGYRVDEEIPDCPGNPGTEGPLLVVIPSLVTTGGAPPDTGPKLVTFAGAGNGGTPATGGLDMDIATCGVVTAEPGGPNPEMGPPGRVPLEPPGTGNGGRGWGGILLEMETIAGCEVVDISGCA